MSDWHLEYCHSKGIAHIECSVVRVLMEVFDVQVFQWMQTIPHYKPDELVYRTIINVLVNARRMNVAEAVFEEFLNSSFVPSHDDYVTLMSGYTKCGSLQRGVNVLQKMRDADITPLVSAYNVLLEGCTRSSRG